MKAPVATAMVGAQTTINNQEEGATATATATATMKAMTTTMKTKATLVAMAAWWYCSSSGSLVAAARLQWEAWQWCWQRGGSNGIAAAVASLA